MRQKEKK